jgi:hypothetical protein
MRPSLALTDVCEQVAPIKRSREPAFAAEVDGMYVAAVRRYGGFQGPFWGGRGDGGRDGPETAAVAE